MVSAKPYAPAVNPAPAPRRTTEGRKSTPWRTLPACWVYYTATPVCPMPPMGLILKPQELEDVKIFLMTLK